jgi:hypothetical protein
MHERQQLTDFQKGQIEGRRRSLSPAKIGNELNIPRRTVANFLTRLDDRGTIENLPQSGRPRRTSAASDRYIVHAAESDTRVPLAELRRQTNSEVSERTLRRRLQDAGIRKWKAVKRPLLTKKHAAQRLKWAKEHRHWTREDWKKVAWSDECAVQKDSDTRAVWVWRRQTSSEKYVSKNIRPKSRDGRISQMIWGCFMGDKLGPIVFIDGNINKDVYIEVLAENLLPFIDALNADGISNIAFQQDNASPHVCSKTMAFLKDSAKQHGFVVVEWPAISPDMNPIENLWSHLKAELHRRYPDTMYLKGSPEAVRRVLKERLMEVWWDIGDNVLNDLVDSMPHRVHALIAANGWYTKY